MLFPRLASFTDLGLLLLRLMVGVVFLSSGWSHFKNPEERSKSIGMSKSFTLMLGIGEMVGSLEIMVGAFTQLAAVGLILIMLKRFKRRSSSGIRDSGARMDTDGTTILCWW